MKVLRKAIAVSLSVAGLAVIVHVYHPDRGAATASAGRAGYTVTIDGNGDFVDGPALVMPIKETDAASFSTSSQGLVLETSPVPGGGQMVDLQGRFRHSMGAVIGSDDNLETECVTDVSAGEADGR